MEDDLKKIKNGRRTQKINKKGRRPKKNEIEVGPINQNQPNWL